MTMARSHAIWIVLNRDIPVAGFTVKHEFETWMSRQTQSVQDSLDVWRLPDGLINQEREVGASHVRIAKRDQGCDGRCAECYPVSALDGEPKIEELPPL